MITCPRLQQQGTRQLTGTKEVCWAKNISIFWRKWVGQETGNRTFFWCGLLKIQKILQIQKGLLSRGATGWMLHFNVRNTFSTCPLVHVEKAIWYMFSQHSFMYDLKGFTTGEKISWYMLLRRQSVLRTLK